LRLITRASVRRRKDAHRRHTRVVSEQPIISTGGPGADYLVKLGEVAYRVSKLEWAALDDP
jgi:hypothetical protein